jgi:hypothetical protein
MKNFKNILCAIALMATLGITAQDFKVSINKLTAETQQLSESPDNLKLVWWIPIEFWQAVFAENKTMPQRQIDEVLQVFEQYTLLAVVDGIIGEFGDITYKPKDTVFNSLEIVDAHKKTYTPLREDTIDEKTLEVISYMKPVLGNMLGDVGKNMYFFLFQKKENPMERIINPMKKEEFTINLGGEAFRWKLPLPSLLKPKKCPVDGQLMNATWKYCPFHGKELIAQ